MDINVDEAYEALTESIIESCSPDSLNKLKLKNEQVQDVRKLEWDGRILWQFCISQNKDDLFNYLNKTRDYPAEATVNKLGSNGLPKHNLSLFIEATKKCHGYKSDTEFLDQFVLHCHNSDPPKEPSAFSEHEWLIDHILSKYNKPSNPFKGLQHFRSEDKDYFFGRGELVEDLAKLIPKKSLTAVIGPSGCGKSSLVFAGIVPAITKDNSWISIVLRLGSKDPFYALSQALAPYYWPKKTQVERDNSIAELQKGLEEDSTLTLRLETTKDNNKNRPILLVIDQFEELFTAKNVEQLKKKAFVDLLTKASMDLQENRIASIIIVMRRDFGDQLDELDANFASIVNENTKNVGFLNDQELLDITTKPLDKYNEGLPEKDKVVFEKSLKKTLLADIRGAAQSLPLIEFTLTELWERRESLRLLSSTYLEIGGIYGALSKHAEELFESLTLDEQKLAEIVFIGLINLGNNGSPDTKKLARKEDFDHEPKQWALIQKLAGGSDRIDKTKRLVIINKDDKGETVELAHDRLVQEWKSLAFWIFKHRDFIKLQEKINNRYSDWKDHGESKEDLLSGDLLIEIESLDKTNNGLLNLNLKDFVRKSRQYSRRKKYQKHFAFASLLIFSAILVYLLDNSIRNELNLQAVVAQQLAKTKDNRKAALVAMQILNSRTISNYDSKFYRKKSLDVLRDLIGRYIEVRRIPIDEINTSAIELSSEADKVAIADKDGAISIWDITSGEIDKIIDVEMPSVSKLSFNPEGKILAISSSLGGFAIYDFSTGAFVSEWKNLSYQKNKGRSPNIVWLSNGEQVLRFQEIEGYTQIELFGRNSDGRYNSLAHTRTLSGCYYLDHENNFLRFIKDGYLKSVSLLSGENIDSWRLGFTESELKSCQVYNDQWYVEFKNGGKKIGSARAEVKKMEFHSLMLDGSMLETEKYVYFEKKINQFVYKDNDREIFYAFDIESGKGKNLSEEMKQNGYFKIDRSILESISFVKVAGLSSFQSKVPWIDMDIEFLISLNEGDYNRLDSILVKNNVVTTTGGEAGFLTIFKKTSFPEGSTTIDFEKVTDNHIAISEDFSIVGFALPNNKIEIRKLKSDKYETVIYPSSYYGEVKSLQLNSDGSKILVAYEKGHIIEWNTNTGMEHGKYFLSSNLINAIYSNDYQRVLVSGSGGENAHIEPIEIELSTKRTIRANEPYDRYMYGLSTEYSKYIHKHWDEYIGYKYVDRKNYGHGGQLISNNANYRAKPIVDYEIEDEHLNESGERVWFTGNSKHTVGLSNQEGEVSELNPSHDVNTMKFSDNEKYLLISDQSSMVSIYATKSGSLKKK